MQTLVTGGCGFIGSHLVEALLEAGHTVRVLDNLSTGHRKNLDKVANRVEIHEGDVRDFDQVLACSEGVDCIFHEAALVSVFDSIERPIDNNDINITGALHVLEAARQQGVRRVIVASSAAIYGNSQALPKTECMLPDPESPYGVAKITDEYYFRSYARLHDLETVCLRYFNVFGPRQDPSSMYAGVISKFMQALEQNTTPYIFGDGQQSRDFVNVRDVVRANLAAMTSTSAGQGEAINVGTGIQTSLLDLVNTLGRLSGKDFSPEIKPERPGDVRHSLADVSRARDLIDFTAEVTVEDGLAEMLKG